MIREKSKKIIENYMMAYNSFDIERRVKLLHKEILFRNFTNGEMNTETRGIQEFRELKEKSSKIFTSRRQTVMDYNAIEDKAEVEIEYERTSYKELSAAPFLMQLKRQWSQEILEYIGINSINLLKVMIMI